jgi:hypothetical protein
MRIAGANEMCNPKNLIVAGAALSVAFGWISQANATVATIGPATFSYYNGSEPTQIPDPYTTYNYGTYTETPGVGITFTGPVAAVDTNIIGISELRDVGGSDTAPNWIGGSSVFGADITATITAPSAGMYSFGFGSDDGGYVFINGNLIPSVIESGPNGYPGLVDFSVHLNKGSNSLEIQYDNIYGPGAVVALSAVPEPATWAMLLLGFAGLGIAAHRRATRKGGAALSAA